MKSKNLVKKLQKFPFTYLFAFSILGGLLIFLLTGKDIFMWGGIVSASIMFLLGSLVLLVEQLGPKWKRREYFGCFTILLFYLGIILITIFFLWFILEKILKGTFEPKENKLLMSGLFVILLGFNLSVIKEFYHYVKNDKAPGTIGFIAISLISLLIVLFFGYIQFLLLSNIFA